MTSRMALAKFVEHNDFLRAPMQKQIVYGTGTRNVKDGMFVSIGRKFDAFCPKSEIGDATPGEAALFLVTSSNNEESVPTVSRVKAAVWEELAALHQNNEVAFVKIVKVDRGRGENAIGLIAEFAEGLAKGMRAHLPAETLQRGADLSKFVGQILPVVVTKLNPQRGDGMIYVNYNRVFGNNKGEAVASIAVGEQLQGRVLKFINAAKGDEHPSVLVLMEKEGLTVEGMIHKTEVTGYPEHKATDFLKVGDRISARILRASTARRTLVLGLRSEERAKFLAGVEEGSIVTGKVSRETSFGYFVDLGNGIEGLLRPHQLIRANKQNETFKKGEEIAVIILEIDAAKDRLLLGRRGLKPEYLKKA